MRLQYQGSDLNSQDLFDVYSLGGDIDSVKLAYDVNILGLMTSWYRHVIVRDTKVQYHVMTIYKPNLHAHRPSPKFSFHWNYMCEFATTRGEKILLNIQKNKLN